MTTDLAVSSWPTLTSLSDLRLNLSSLGLPGLSSSSPGQDIWNYFI